MADAARIRSLVASGQQEDMGVRQAWSACAQSVHGPLQSAIDSEYVQPYLRDMRRALAAYEDLARVLASVESELGIG